MEIENRKFSLKDRLFNKTNVTQLSLRIKDAYSGFDSSAFAAEVLKDFKKLELKQRIERITECLEVYLPKEFSRSLKIILKSLPDACDNNKTDDDFGDFIYEPFNLFIARNGCRKDRLKESLEALEQTTQRFSAEFALRSFIKEFEKETLVYVKRWSKHKHYHVRRLASEGIRPNLPWGGKIQLSPQKIIFVLDNLYSDRTRFVTRSVANNLNDITKINPDLVLSTLRRWEKEKKQIASEFKFIQKHALRTLIRKGDQKTLSYLGFSKASAWRIKKMLFSEKVKRGEVFNFECELELNKGSYIIDYIIHYASKNNLLRKKVFKAAKVELAQTKLVSIKKSHGMKDMSTRKIFPGDHVLELQVNGVKSKSYNFKVF